MAKYLCIIFVLILLFSSNESILLDEEEQIIFSFHMFRNGARAPYLGVTEGKDNYNEEWIANEELSNMGKRMLYLLGLKFRYRYQYFLNKFYSPQEILIKSTDNNRTIESVYSFLQGLYPSGPEIQEKVRFNKDLIYPPNKKYFKYFDDILNTYEINETGDALPNKMNIAPIHIIYKPDLDFDLQSEEICPAREKILSDSYQSEKVFNFVDDIINKTGDFFMQLEKSQNSSFLKDYWNIYRYMDSFFVDDFDQRNFDFIKNKYGEEIINILKNFSQRFLDMHYYEINFPEKDEEDEGVMINSPLMGYILNWMEIAKNKSGNNINSYLKYVIYSAHNLNIANLDYFMKNIFNTSFDECDFACSRVFELYKKNNEYFVRYLKGTDEVKLDLSYNEFVGNISNIIWDKDKIKEYCDVEQDEFVEDKKSAAFYIMISLIIVDAILIMFLIAFIKNKK